MLTFFFFFFKWVVFPIGNLFHWIKVDLIFSGDAELYLMNRRSRPSRLTFRWWRCYGLCQRHKPTELAHSFFFFYSVLASVSVFMFLSSVFHSINSPDKSLFSRSVLTGFFCCLIGPFNYITLYKSLLRLDIVHSELKTPINSLSSPPLSLSQTPDHNSARISRTLLRLLCGVVVRG